MFSPIVIIADDLTGALDSSCMFPSKGFKTRVYSDLPEYTDHLKKDIKSNPSQIIVFNTETRNSSNIKIASTYDYMFSKHKWLFMKSRIFKKVDSTIRGNIGFEIKVILKKMNLPYAFVCISYPELKRTQSNGVLKSDGIPIDHSKNNPNLFPNIEYQTEKLLEIQSGLKTGLITQKEISIGEKHLLIKLKTLIESETKIICFDALTRQDLNKIYATTKNYFPKALLVGSAGLTKSILTAVKPTSYKPRSFRIRQKSFALISLSFHPITKMHFIKLSAHDGILHVSIDTDALLCKKSFDKEYERVSCIIDYAISTKQNIAINQSTQSAIANPNTVCISKHLRIFLSKISARLISFEFYKTLILIGGDTAHTVLQTAGIKEIDVVKEILPGTAISFPGVGYTKKFRIITKSGGFGDENHISDLLSKLL